MNPEMSKQEKQKKLLPHTEENIGNAYMDKLIVSLKDLSHAL